MEPRIVQIYFSDFFGVSPKVLDDYGAFDVSLINDLPLLLILSFYSTAISPSTVSCMTRSSATFASYAIMRIRLLTARDF